MKERNYIKDIVRSQKEGKPRGIYSVCSYNKYVLEATFQEALENRSTVLIESTCNQVNQYGGYTRMTPNSFRSYVFSIANSYSFPEDKIILGGDHLGPFPFREELSDIAMGRACEMVKQYVLAGYDKIHLDTSMSLKGDPIPLSPDIAAARCADLCYVAEEAFKKLKENGKRRTPPLYVIGTEVPAPGGSDEVEHGIVITKVSDLEETISITKKYFYEKNLQNAWERVIAVVVQPGVEHGDHTIVEYNRDKAKELTFAIKRYQNIVFEGHTTDFQTKRALREMVEDGIAILKVGPSLTYAVREAVFMLNYIEEELLKNNKDVTLSHFIEIFDEAMRNNPKYWNKYYTGDEETIRFKRKYSFFDRARYYWVDGKVKDALNTLIKNLRSVDLPFSIISQFLPRQYKKIREGTLDKDPESLIRGRVMDVLKNYSYAS